mmetsp:Transcript_9683/g.13586  ORF Transcript_9683/g.13586 Transcript_9683/m.13586 type:complete len:143 (+) Transcript_9683:648-1076(+)
MELLSKLPCTYRCETTPPSDCSARNVAEEKKQVAPSRTPNYEESGVDLYAVQEGNAGDSGHCSPPQECPIDDCDERSQEIHQECCGTVCPTVFFCLAGTVLPHHRSAIFWRASATYPATCFGLHPLLQSMPPLDILTFASDS